MQILEKQTDDQLVAAYAQGNNKAFDTLLARHQTRIFNYVMHLVKDQDIANDLFQEIFVKVITTIKQGKYSETGKFSAWLTRIAHNMVIDHFRQDKSAATISTDDAETPVLNRKEQAVDNIENQLIDFQIEADVRRLVKLLPEEQRNVLVMRYYQDLSFKEIADKTGVSINTALGRMRYALINMRKLAKERNIVLTR